MVDVLDTRACHVPLARPDDAAALCGELSFVAAPERSAVLRRWHDEARLVVIVDVAPSARTRLAEVIEESVERTLGAHGAAAPGIGTAGDPEAQLSDQLFRARRAGKRGIALALGKLRAIAGTRGALDADDSATLGFFATATHTRPLALLLDADDATTGACGDPIPLASLMMPTPGLSPEPEPDPGPELVPVPDPVTVTVTVTDPDLAPTRSESHTAGAAVAADDNDDWRAFLLALTAARGPQPLAAFEKLFTQSYLPLTTAIARGLTDPRACQATDDFRRTFARSFAEAVPTFALTGKRPRMVLDAPDIAARIARLHGARSTQLLCVDAMRWDLGALVATSVARTLGPRASLTEEMNLFAALPSTTLRQLECIARGPDALREKTNPEADDTAARGRGAEVLRRMRVGSRDLYKLDLVEARLRTFEAAGDGARATLDAFPEIAERVADVIGKHAATLAARTLLFVFGDHGFAIDASGAARQGGSSPEEVLVPAYAFLVGAVH